MLPQGMAAIPNSYSSVPPLPPGAPTAQPPPPDSVPPPNTDKVSLIVILLESSYVVTYILYDYVTG